MGAILRTGVTAWAERALVATGWYPPGVSTPEARLRYYATRFSVVENDSSYWAIPDPQTAGKWSAWTPDGFVMNVKAHALLTGHYTDPKRLPPTVRAALPASLRMAARVYPRHLGPALMDEVTAQFRAALAPLSDAGRLGVVVFQFPVWFPWSRDHEREVVRWKSRLAPYRVAVELRNATWMNERHRARTLERFAAAGVSYVCVDEPQGFVSSVPPIAAATSDIAVVRMHGRNAARWSRGATTSAERFDYLYGPDELREWVPRVRALADQSREVHVLFNNCHADYAVRNAQQMTELLAELQPHAENRPGAP